MELSPSLRLTLKNEPSLRGEKRDLFISTEEFESLVLARKKKKKKEIKIYCCSLHWEVKQTLGKENKP